MSEDIREQINITIANLIINDWRAIANKDEIIPSIDPDYIWGLAFLVTMKKISSAQAKIVFTEMATTNEDPVIIINRLGLVQSIDANEISAWCDTTIEANQKSVTEYKNGKTAAINALVGGVMKLSKGKANPALVKETLVAKLTS